MAERNSKFAHISEGNKDFDESRTIFAGKFRRYHGESWIRRLFDIKTNLLNLRDLVFVILGTLQSLVLLWRLKPDATLLKGGFVGMPVGLAAAFWRRPFVTHDSDALPGLANRLVSRWATYNATGMPPEFYSYPAHKAQYVGVLVGGDYGALDESTQAQYKRDLSIPVDNIVLLITGGSHGAKRLNTSVRRLVPRLLDDYSKLHVVHQVGQGHLDIYEGFSHERLDVQEFLKPMFKYTGSADVVVTRAGANTLAELGVQGKACIVVPNPLLTGGHQLKNAENLMRKNAVVAVDEADFKHDGTSLDRAIRTLLQDEQARTDLGTKLKAISIPDAAHKLAMLLLDLAKR